MRRNGWQERGLVVLFVASLWLGPFGEAPARAAEDPFATAIRPTAPRSPEQERASFHLPPGFEIQLVAAEPEIQKPMNMAFDAKGRLWVSGSIEYPFPVPKDRKGRDSIRILEDIDGDGRADKVTTFADGLNIPIGLYPYKNGVIAFSIPNIWFFEDTDGDGKADKRDVALRPVRLHARHARHEQRLSPRVRRLGLRLPRLHQRLARSRARTAARSTCSPATPSASGSTARASSTSPGAGQSRSAWPSTRSATSSPPTATPSRSSAARAAAITPASASRTTASASCRRSCEHDHGSTAIAGIACYAGDHFPQEYPRQHVHRQRHDQPHQPRHDPHHGLDPAGRSSSPTSSPATTPGSARSTSSSAPTARSTSPTSTTGSSATTKCRSPIPAATATAAASGGSSTSAIRTGPRRPLPRPTCAPPQRSNWRLLSNTRTWASGCAAGDELVDRIGEKSAGPVRAVLHGDDATSRAHALWALHRLGAVRFDDLASAALDADRLVRIHAMRVLSETFPGSVEIQSLILKCLRDGDPLVQRGGRCPRPTSAHRRHRCAVRPLASHARVRRPPPPCNEDRPRKADRGPRHAHSMALSDHSPSDAELMTEIALSLPTEEAGAFLLDHFQRHPVRSKTLGRLLVHAARTLNKDSDLEVLVAIARKNIADHLDVQRDMLFAIRDGLQQRGQAKSTLLRSGATASLASSSPRPMAMTNGSRSRTDERGGPAWHLETRESANNAPATSFLSSLPLGERYTDPSLEGVRAPSEAELLRMRPPGPVRFAPRAQEPGPAPAVGDRRGRPAGPRTPQRCRAEGELGPLGACRQDRLHRGHRRGGRPIVRLDRRRPLRSPGRACAQGRPRRRRESSAHRGSDRQDHGPPRPGTTAC